MKLSVELTFVPLQSNYQIPITNFIKKMRSSGLTVLENPLSTQIYGEFEEVMTLLNKEMKHSFSEIDEGIFNLKILKTDRSNYVPSN